MESNVIWVDFKGRSRTIDWLACAKSCEDAASRETRPNIKRALLRIAEAYRAKVSPDACSLNG